MDIYCLYFVAAEHLTHFSFTQIRKKRIVSQNVRHCGQRLLTILSPEYILSPMANLLVS